MTFDEALRLLRALQDAGVEYVLVGSMAMAVHGLVRATRDIDLFVRPDEPTVAALRQALRGLYDDPEIDGLAASDLAGDYPVVQYLPPGDASPIDVLGRLGTAMLFRMKRDTVRPQDAADAARLAERFDVGD